MTGGFMRNLQIVLLFFLMTTYMSCSKRKNHFMKVDEDGIISVFNNTEGAYKELKLSLEEKLDIKGDVETDDQSRIFNNPVSLDCDKYENIFILDGKSCSVKKFSKDGVFLKSFLKKGSGPGETTSASILNIHRDTLKIFAGREHKIIKFSLAGEFLGDQKFNSKTIPMTLKLIDQEKEVYLGHIWEESIRNKEYYVTISIVILDKSYRVVKKLQSTTQKYIPSEFNLLELMGSYTASVNRIYLASPATDEYLVFVYDFKGNLVRKIYQNFSEVKMKKSEAENFNKNLKNVYGTKLQSTKIKKRAINSLYIDSYNRLWVVPSVKRTSENYDVFYTDIFNPDGVFLKRCQLPQLTGRDYFNLENQLFFYGNRIYYISHEDCIVKVYEY